MTCGRCGNAFDGRMCACGWGRAKAGLIAVEAPWRHFICVTCQYSYCFRSFDAYTPTVCRRCTERTRQREQTEPCQDRAETGVSVIRTHLGMSCITEEDVAAYKSNAADFSDEEAGGTG